MSGRNALEFKRGETAVALGKVEKVEEEERRRGEGGIFVFFLVKVCGMLLKM